MLNILFLTHRLPFPPDRGDRIRSYHLIRHLARRHRISLAAVVDLPPDEAHVRHLETLCASVDVARVDRRCVTSRPRAICRQPCRSPCPFLPPAP